MALNLENKRQIIIFALALVVGVLAVYLMGLYIEDQNKKNAQKLFQQIEEQKKNFEQTRVMMANEINLVRKEQQQMENQILAKLKENPPQEAGGMPSTFSLRTPPGKRALAIRIDSLSAVGGLLSPGDFIDIIAHLRVPKSDDLNGPTDTVTTILFQNIEILAINVNYKIGSGGAFYGNQQQAGSLNITLSVSAEEANLLTFAQMHGNLQFSLRSPTEKNIEQSTEPASWQALSDFIAEKQGTKISVPHSRKAIDINEPTQEEEPAKIEIFKSGQKY